MEIITKTSTGVSMVLRESVSRYNPYFLGVRMLERINMIP